jgi:PAS domain S-box-containing protein
MNIHKPISDSESSTEELKRQLDEALEALEAIRTGQVDAIVVQAGTNHELYTLQSADRSYRTFIENMSEGAVTLHRDGTIDYANAQFAEFLGRPLAEVIGRHFTDFVARHSRDLFIQALDSCLQHHGYRIELDLAGIMSDIPALLSMTTLQSAEDYTFPMIVTDLREQRKARHQLQDQNRALLASNYDLQQFASVASHDLQEPLRKISTFTGLLLQREATQLPEQRQLYLQKIRTSAARMQQLIVDVLNFSRLSAGPGHFELVNLNTLVEDIVEDFELVIAEKGAIVEVSPLPAIRVQPVQMSQALRNILSNALKFNQPGVPPRISVTGIRVAALSFESPETPDGQFCLLRIQDNGIGFKDVYLEKIFSLFQRLHGQDTYEGTGIGLAITKKIIEQHKGLIDALGHEGTGAEFRILLPMDQHTIQA